MIAALFVMKKGCYKNLPHVDPWDEDRDARNYNGPYPVIAHPPCERWGSYWGGSPTTFPRLKKGDDKGCFADALLSVRRFGGVLEHPKNSAAWDAFGLSKPPYTGGWISADRLGFTCCVEQGAYGHRARKATWLYSVGTYRPELRWGKTNGNFIRLDAGYHTKEERARAIKTGMCQILSKNERAATPLEFRDLLIELAESVYKNGVYL